jgi:hypothetical protein
MTRSPFPSLYANHFCTRGNTGWCFHRVGAVAVETSRSHSSLEHDTWVSFERRCTRCLKTRTAWNQAITTEVKARLRTTNFEREGLTRNGKNQTGDSHHVTLTVLPFNTSGWTFRPSKPPNTATLRRETGMTTASLTRLPWLKGNRSTFSERTGNLGNITPSI